MPRLNGIDLVGMIKQDPRTGSTPVIIVSYKDRQEDRLRGMEAGADYYLTNFRWQQADMLPGREYHAVRVGGTRIMAVQRIK